MLITRELIIRKWQNFCSRSTLHGVWYLGTGSKATTLLWSGALVASSVLCGVLAQMMWTKYTRNPTLTIVESTQEPVALVPFPTVVVCASPPAVPLPAAIGNVTRILTARGYSPIEITAFYESLGRVADPRYTPSHRVEAMHILLTSLGYKYDDLLRMVTWPCEWLLEFCVWRSQRHPCYHMFQQVELSRGPCCLFELDYFRNTTANISTETGVSGDEALMFTLTNQVLGGETNVDVFVVKDRESMPILSDGVALASRVHYDVRVAVHTMTCKPQVFELSQHIRKCLTLEESSSVGGGYDECRSRLLLREAATRCRCLPMRYTAQKLRLIEQYSPCSWDRYLCVFRTLNELGEASLLASEEESTCFPLCENIQYEIDVQYLPLRFTDKTFNGSSISVHWAQSTCIKYRRELIYTWDQLLANLGGIFGLCLGGSLISILELVWFLGELIMTIAAPTVNQITTTQEQKLYNKTKTNVTVKTTRKRGVSNVKKKVDFVKLPYLN